MTRQTKLKLKRGFVKAPLAYKILAVNQIKEADYKLISKALVKVTNEATAKALTGHGSKWGYKFYNLAGFGELTYKGIKVAMLYKRVMLTIVPDPEDPVPEGTLEDPDDVWLMVPMFGLSARQQAKLVRKELESQEEESDLLRMEVLGQEHVISNLEIQVKGLQTLVKKNIKEALKDPELNRHVRSTIAQHHNELELAAKKARRKGIA